MYNAAMKFSIKSAVRYGWDTFWKRPGLFVGATVIILLASIVATVVANGLETLLMASKDYTFAVEPEIEVTFSFGLGFFVQLTLNMLIAMGAAAFYLAAHDDLETLNLRSLWHPHPFWKFLITWLFVLVVIIFGLFLLIVPGIIFALMLLFTSFVVIERELDPLAAMGESRRIARGHKWRLLGFVIVLGLINLLGALLFGVGLLITIPISMLAFVHVYRLLAEKVAPKQAA